jgi:hypothetical protein
VDVDEEHRSGKAGDRVGDPVLPRLRALLFALEKSRIDRGPQLGDGNEDAVQALAQRLAVGFAVGRRTGRGLA